MFRDMYKKNKLKLLITVSKKSVEIFDSQNIHSLKADIHYFSIKDHRLMRQKFYRKTVIAWLDFSMKKCIDSSQFVFERQN